MYGGNSINKVNFAQGLGIEILLIVSSFQRNQLWWVFLSSWRLSAWPYRLLCPEEFITGESNRINFMDCLFDSGSCGKPIFSPFVNIVLTKMFHSANHTFFRWFHMACPFQPPNIWWQVSVQIWNIRFNYPPFWIVSNKHLTGLNLFFS